MKSLSLWLASLTFLAASLPAGAEVKEKDILNLIKSLDRKKAVDTLSTLDQSDPMVMFYLARLERDADSAVTLFKKVVRSAPEHDMADDALFEVAQYNYALGYYNTAINLYLDLLATYPKSIHCEPSLYWGAAGYLAIRQPTRARKLYEKYLAQYSDMSERIYLGIGDSYYVEKEYEQALRAFQMLIRSYPHSELYSTACSRIAECYTILGRDDKAEAYKKKVLTAEPTSVQARAYSQPKPRITIAPPQPEEPGGEFVVQVGVYSQQPNAHTVRDRVKELGYPAEISVTISGAVQLYRVWVGPYGSKDEAKKMGEQLKAKGNFDYIVKKREK